MPAITLNAHYDGQHILLDEPFDLQPSTRLMVTVLPALTDSDYAAWANLSGASLAKAYGDQEPEYFADDLRRQ